MDAWLLSIQGFAFVAALLFKLRIRRLSKVLRGIEAERRESDGALLAASTIPLRFQPEIEWALLEGRSMSVVAFQLDPTELDIGGAALRQAMRRYENAFRLDDSTMIAALWDSDEAGSQLAVHRLGTAVARAVDREWLEVGTGHMPTDGATAREVIRAARSSLRPQQFNPVEAEPAAPQEVRPGGDYMFGSGDLTPELLRSASFTHHDGRYDADEVRVFLDRVASALETLLAQDTPAALRAELRRNAEIARQVFEAGQQAADQVRRQAALEARALLEDTRAATAQLRAGVEDERERIRGQLAAELRGLHEVISEAMHQYEQDVTSVPGAIRDAA